MKRARVYRRGRWLFFHAVSCTNEGVWVVAPPFVRVEDGTAETFLGETLGRTLAVSRSGARDTSDTRTHLLALSRARTWRTFLREALVCDVERDDTGIRFYPSRSRRPFLPEGEHAVALPARALAIHMGAALLMAFRVVEPRRNRLKQGDA
jgi:hypothetical protein